ncbi:MAG: DNA ligase LigA-related protein, partial [Alphaproteobacteria bacterium]
MPDRITALRAEIEKHNRLYYQNDAPIISDADYDELVRALRALEGGEDSLNIGAPALETFDKIPHDTQMMSLDNAMNTEDVEAFFARACRFLDLPEDTPLPCWTEPKIDGLSLNLIYDNGHLVSAATRGD